MAEGIKPSEPIFPVDATNCPTCFSGVQPVDPPHADTITPGY